MVKSKKKRAEGHRYCDALCTVMCTEIQTCLLLASYKAPFNCSNLLHMCGPKIK